MNKNIVYLDNNATTKCDEQVILSMLPYFKDEYGNHSRLMNFGKKSKMK